MPWGGECEACPEQCTQCSSASTCSECRNGSELSILHHFARVLTRWLCPKIYTGRNLWCIIYSIHIFKQISNRLQQVKHGETMINYVSECRQTISPLTACADRSWGLYLTPDGFCEEICPTGHYAKVGDPFGVSWWQFCSLGANWTWIVSYS